MSEIVATLRQDVRHAPVLLDLDGTVVDSARAIFAAIRAACGHVGVRLPEGTDLSFAFGPPLHSSLQALGVPDDRMDEAIAEFADAHWERFAGMLRPMPGCVESLTAFVRVGIPIGIVTVKPTHAAVRSLELLGIEHLVSVVIGRTDDFDPRTKTDLLGEALEHAALGGHSPLFVGDQPTDEAAANAHRVRFLWHPDVTWDQIRTAVLA